MSELAGIERRWCLEKCKAGEPHGWRREKSQEKIFKPFPAKVYPLFLEEKLVVEGRKVGRATTCRLNVENPKAAFMARVHGEAGRMQSKRKKTLTPSRVFSHLQ